MRRAMLACGAVLAAALGSAAIAAPGGGLALPSPPSCGDTITTDTKLSGDLTNCPDDGIVIGADDITLDLNGHTVSGNGDVGIDSAGHSRVTITGGAVHGFDLGVRVEGGRENRIENVESAGSASFGVILADARNSRVDHNSAADDGISGILVFDCTGSRIDHNDVSGSSGYALPVFGSSHNRLDHNVLTRNEHGILLESSDEHEGSNNNEVMRNRITHGGSIEIDHSTDNRVERNVIEDVGDGLLLIEARNTLVSSNTVTGVGWGFPDAGGFGILLDGADHNTIERNSLTGGEGPGILVTTLESEVTPDRNALALNVVSGNANDGIRVDSAATSTVLERNVADRNGDDGIDIAAAGTTVTRNTADLNSDLGIEAVPGTVDGGANWAWGNGNPLQCTNVTCRGKEAGER